MKKRMIAVVLALVCLVSAMAFPASAASDGYADVTIRGTQDYDQINQVLQLVNQERAAAGLSPVVMDPILTAHAMQRAAEIAVYYSHTRPNGNSWTTALDPQYDYAARGENIAIGYASARSVMTAWMGSEGHKANILYGNFAALGVGCFYQDDGSICWVQLFSSFALSDTYNEVGKKHVSNIPIQIAAENLIVKLQGIQEGDSISLYQGSGTALQVYLGNKAHPYMTPVYMDGGYSLTVSDPAIAQVDPTTREIIGTAPGSGTLTILADEISCVSVPLNIYAQPTLTLQADGNCTLSWEDIPGLAYLFGKEADDEVWTLFAYPQAGNHTYTHSTVNPGETWTYVLRARDAYANYVDISNQVTYVKHDYVSEITEATCTEQGYTTHTCTVCGDSYVDNYVEPLGHDYESTIVEPTCTAQGYTSHTCTRCAHHYEDAYVDVLGHEYTSEVVAPTCTEQGYTLHTCSRCEDSYMDTYVTALGHDWGEWAAWENDLERRDCSRCDQFETRDTVHVHSYESVVTAPTCTQQGYTTHTCTECGHSYVDSYVAALGHTPAQPVKEKEIPATCETSGSYEHVVHCSLCDLILSSELIKTPALGHNYEAVVTEPTCTEQGYTTHTCSACGDSYVDEYVDALDHDYESEIVDPDCEEQGCTMHTCSRCGDSYKDTFLEALGHDLGEWAYWENGLERRDCTRCDHYETREGKLAAPAVQITNVASSGKPKLTWNKVPGAVKYEVYRATSKTGTYTRLSTTTGTSLTNSSTEVGKTYYYKVRSVAADSTKSEFSSIVSRTCDLPRPEITLSNIASSGKIKITWAKIDGATRYEVYRSTDNKTWSLLKSTTGTSLTNTSTTAGTTYYYKVKAIASSSAANSAYSTVKSRTCDLAQPTISSLTITASTGKIKIKWGAVEGATKYELYCSTDNQTWKKLTATTGTSINHNSAVAGTKYYYKVRAISSNSAANSAYSAVKYGTCDLARPTLTVKLNTSGKPYLTWTKIEGAVKYEIYRSTDNKTWTKLSTTTGTKLTNTSAKAGTTYYYKVRAIASNTAANSAYSTVKSIAAK